MLVEFSGGLDSSLVLVAAAEAARREGRPAPIPVTLRFSSADSDEREYQEAVVDHLGLADWVVLTDDRHVDYLSDVTRRELRRDGLKSSARIAARAWWLQQLSDRFGPFTLLSGEGGDEAFGPGPLAPAFRLGRAIATRRNVGATAKWTSAWAKREALSSKRKSVLLLPRYLTPKGAEMAVEALRAGSGRRSVTVRQKLVRFRSRKIVVDVVADLTAQASRFDAHYHAPFLDLEFLVWLSALPQTHFLDRNYFFERHFASLLPEVILRRRTKADFRDACFGPESKAFAERWDGTGVPTDLVDVDQLRQCWLEGSDARSSLLLQRAWMASEGLV